MKNRKKAKTMPKLKYMPPELLSQIFAALPVKTLVRFRSVCKSWCSIIDDPDFILLHLNLFKINSGNKKLLALEGLGKFGTAGCMLTVRQGNTLEKSAHIFDSCHRYYLLGECNGLFLMHDCSNELRLWNPCIRKSLVIPPCPFSIRSGPVMDKYLFGFANCSQDYKIIAISCRFDRPGPIIKKITDMCVAVYTLNDQQWTVRDNHDLNISSRYFAYRFLESYSAAVAFRGASYWVGTDPFWVGTGPYYFPDSYKPTHLLSFDFDLEKFTSSEFPFGLEEQRVLRLVFRLRDSLAIFNVSFENASIWVMKQESGKDVWIQCFSGRSCKQVFDLFARHDNGPVFYIESDIGRCLVLDNKNLYNIDSGQVELIGNEMSPYLYLYLKTYCESLVLCSGYGAKDLTSFP